jgi:hypothetical protein
VPLAVPIPLNMDWSEDILSAPSPADAPLGGPEVGAWGTAPLMPLFLPACVTQHRARCCR